jgi:peroxin-1
MFRFNFKFFASFERWFKSNVAELMAHFKEFFLNPNRNSNILPRGLILHGYRGCGKSTLCKYVCNYMSREPFKVIYQYVNCKNFIGKSVEFIHEQLKLVYQECLWYESCPSLVVLENLDLLIENKSESNDPNAMLYYSQIVEALKSLLNFCWDSNSSNVVTLVTMSCPIELMPSIFHSLDEHGLFTSFVRVKLHSDQEETREIVEMILKDKQYLFDKELIEAIVKLAESFVFKDIEKLINKIIFNKWSRSFSAPSSSEPSESLNKITLENSENVLYSYTCINMFETKFYRSKSAISWDSVGGLNNIKKTLVESLIWPFKYRNLYARLNMKQSGGVLLYGPSGCGKTLIASALANECKFNFLSVKGPELLNKYIGSSEQNVRDLFGKAEKAKPCIIFFDEFDSLAPKRGHDSTGVTDRVVNQLLTQLDGIEGLDGVYLIAASSRPDLIDQALLRPSRIDNFLYLPFPDKNEIFEIYSLYLKDINRDDQINLREIAELSTDFSGADIKSVVCDAVLRAFHRIKDVSAESIQTLNQNLDSESIRESIKIEAQDLIQSIQSIRKSISALDRAKLKYM